MIDLYVILSPLLLLPLFALVRFVGCTPFGQDIILFATLTANPTTITKGESATLTWSTTNLDSQAIDQGINTVAATGSISVTPAVTTTYTITGSGATSKDHNGNVTSIGSISATATVTVKPAPPTPPPPPATPIVYRQSAENSQTLNNNSVSTMPFGGPITAGNLIAVWVFWHNTGVQVLNGVTDSAGNVYQAATVVTAGAGTLAGFQQQIWYAKNVKAGTGVTVTATFSGTFADEKNIGAYEYSAADKNAPVDKVAAGTGTGANASVGPVATTARGLIFAAGVFQSNGTSGPGFTQRSTLKNNAVEDHTTTAPISAVAGFSNTAQSWIAQMVAFK